MKEVRGNHFNFKYDMGDEAVSKTIIETAENTYDQVTKEYGIKADDISPLIAEGIDGGTATFNTECPTYEEWDKGHLKEYRAS